MVMERLSPTHALPEGYNAVAGLGKMGPVQDLHWPLHGTLANTKTAAITTKGGQCQLYMRRTNLVIERGDHELCLTLTPTQARLLGSARLPAPSPHRTVFAQPPMPILRVVHPPHATTSLQTHQATLATATST